MTSSYKAPIWGQNSHGADENRIRATVAVNAIFFICSSPTKTLGIASEVEHRTSL